MGPSKARRARNLRLHIGHSDVDAQASKAVYHALHAFNSVFSLSAKALQQLTFAVGNAIREDMYRMAPMMRVDLKSGDATMT
jgi:hypothetical protein